MATAKSAEPAPEESQYTKDGTDGKPVGPEHDQSFSAPDFYDPKTGKRIETAWDSEAQKSMPDTTPVVTEEPAAPTSKDTSS